MTTIDELPVFTDIDEQPLFVGHGDYGTVYAINRQRNLAAKIWKSGWDNSYVFSEHHIAEAQREHDIARELYQNAISVPRPEGVFHIALPSLFPGQPYIPAFIMEHVRGVQYYSLNSEGRIKARELHAQELEKIRDTTRFVPQDVPFKKNCLYQLGENETEVSKVILFDFGNWFRRSTEVSR